MNELERDETENVLDVLTYGIEHRDPNITKAVVEIYAQAHPEQFPPGLALHDFSTSDIDPIRPALMRFLERNVEDGRIRLYDDDVVMAKVDVFEPLKYAPQPIVPKQSFFRAKVVDDETNKPVPGVEVDVALADGSKRGVTSGVDGLIELQGVDPGAYDVSCSLERATVANTLEFVAMGESPAGGSKPKPKGPGKTTKSRRAGTGQAAFRVARIKRHKVRSGDTLPKIASDNDLSQTQLAYFNWEVYSVPKIEERLRDEFGCRNRDEEGRVMFEDQDEPGIIYVPDLWSEENLADGRCHTIRVRSVGQTLPDLRFLYQLDPHEPNVQNDTLTLETEDGSWSHELPVSALPEVHPGWVELVFPEPPTGALFNLVQDPKDGEDPFYIFKGLSYGEIREAEAELEAIDDAP